MKLKNLRFGEIVARMPQHTLVKNANPEDNKLYLLDGGFLNSRLPDNTKVIKFDITTAKDGSDYKWMLKNKE